MVCNIFEVDVGRFCLSDNSADIRPKVARVVFATLLSSDAVGLAWITRNDAMNSATPRSAIEGSGVCPNRRIIHEALFDARYQLRAGIGFSLHVTDRSSAWNCQSDGEVKTTVACADG
ncbi:MAG TPA: hypothetical protein VJS44_00905 [Pyrinomonadaceae bacterium]|nr:hypothetical protein [Pyrinomonadaceae bacterium]